MSDVTRVPADRPLRWGILSTGWMAATFTEDLLRMPDHEVVAVGSRTPDAAHRFAAKYGIPRAHGSYAELAEDAGVDVVYVATPHSGHHDATLRCLRAGRSVLCEKAFTVTAAEAEELVAVAREERRFLMEAMWTRFSPGIVKVRELVADGVIGDVRAVLADFGINVPYDPEHRLYDPALGGGALLDLGIYPISLAWMLLGEPSQVRALASRAATGVDANTGVLFGYDGGQLAVLHSTVESASPVTATILGTAGRIEIHSLFFRPTSITVTPLDGEAETHTVELDGHGYTYQAAEVARCLRAGELESPLMPLDESVAIMRTMDTILRRLDED
jgi:predicted dehydrogenase